MTIDKTNLRFEVGMSIKIRFGINMSVSSMTHVAQEGRCNTWDEFTPLASAMRLVIMVLATDTFVQMQTTIARAEGSCAIMVNKKL